MRAMLVDDEERPEVKELRGVIEEFGLELDNDYLFVGPRGANAFCQAVRLLEDPPDVALIDFSLHWEFLDAKGKERWNGDSVARFLREHWKDAPPFYVVFYSAKLQTLDGRYEQLVELLRVPYAGYVEFSPGTNWQQAIREQLQSALDLVRAEHGRSIAALTGVSSDVGAFFGEVIVGRAPSLLEVGRVACRVSRTNATVLITGESGTGKELMARAIHGASPRAGRQFAVINCGAIPENLLESELFGHTRSAFTGAVADRIGKFESANGGTVFLDEIGEMPTNLQVKLLRVLQEREIERVGERRVRPVDVRIIAATNRVLEEDVKAGRFREDLYYRLNVMKVPMPPLRERAADVLDLADVFLHRATVRHSLPVQRFSAGARRALKSHHWPGNVRELENAVERAALMCDGTTVEANHLPDSVLGGAAEHHGDTWLEAEEEFKRAYYSRVLAECGGNITKAAAMAGISREHFSKTLKQLRISVPGA